MADQLNLDRSQIRLLVDRLDLIVEWVAEELENAITCQVAFTDKTLARVTSDGETPLAFNERASDCAHQLLGTLRAWTNHVATEKGLPWPGDGRAPHFARWLSRHIYDVAGTDQAGDAFTEILDAYDNALHTIDRPAQKTRTIDDEQRTEARALELNAKACADMARTMGGDYRGLTKRRVLHLIDAQAVTPLRHVTAGRWQSPILRLGDVLDAHLDHPTSETA
ncbi:hypothetical protein A6F56_01170 [Prescottella equi]|uniref:hypothetical protein n=1 Tax=Rhodococcus hoagii TaxID=43767 RepID=UPI000A10294F|nr:hypothetical protein [Prescottella equi]ORL00989.1 hypothetical protein A6F56_01170 [Prescottella equi]